VSGAVFFVRLTYNSAVRLSFSRIDGWLLLMTFFWGSNFSIIKTAIREMPGPAFNGLRMVLASLVFLVILGWRDGLRASVAKVERRDWIPILVLSLVGHGLYQLLFLGGVARTSVANSSLIFGLTPVTVSLMSAWLGHERPGWTRWAGTSLSLFGIYLVVAHARQPTSSLVGDVLILAAMLSWATYTVGTRPLLERYSPVFITGLTMAIGTLMYAPFALLWLRGVDLRAVSPGGWAGIIYSALFSLVAAYVIWYTAVREVGGGHTAIYSNIVPLVAIAIAAVVLHEPLTTLKIVGAAAVLGGVALTRLDVGGRGSGAAVDAGCPVHEG
jgi:drug/metabolite transporter (DMT)-like permease